MTDPIEELLAILESADRIGSAEDVPEGARYIQISDTLATKLTSCVRAWQASEPLSDEELMQIAETAKAAVDVDFSGPEPRYGSLLLPAMLRAVERAVRERVSR